MYLAATRWCRNHHFFITTNTLQKDKRFRMERSELERLIFKAFETHQFYFLKTLVNRTDQPQVWVKEVVKDVCAVHAAVLCDMLHCSS